MGICKFWSHVPRNDKTLKCPVSFSEEEIDEQSANEEMWCDLNRLVIHWRNVPGGMSEEAWVRSDMYDYALKRNDQLRKELYESEGATADEIEKLKRGWPFQDHEDFC
jgi:hypothetical protein